MDLGEEEPGISSDEMDDIAVNSRTLYSIDTVDVCKKFRVREK